MARRSYSKPHSVGFEAVRSRSGLPAARWCLARASLNRLDFRFQFVRLANISRDLARDVPAVVDEGENSGEKSECGKHKYQDAVTKGLRSLRAGSGSVLVAHGATLRRSGRSEGNKQQRKAESDEYGEPNCEADLHCVSKYIKSPDGAAAFWTTTKAQLQRLKPILLSANMSRLKPRPTKIPEL